MVWLRRLAIFLVFLVSHVKPDYLIGTGIADITGPVVEINMMGYANPGQSNEGIHTRLFSRAYIIAESELSEPIVFVSIDQGMTSQIVKTQVCNKLKELYGDKYKRQNVMISATHTHSGPAGYFQYLLYAVTSKGFVSQSYDAIVEGIVNSITMAHKNIKQGKIFINRGDILDASINRSPFSYLANPAEERAQYSHNVDTEMTLLKFVHNDGTEIGMLNWFAVHATSMNFSNHLTSSDNKGLAAILFEADFNKNSLTGQGPFVGAFAQANEGDVSPNTKGPRCIDSGEPCDLIQSTCGGRVQNCIAFGPGKDMFESTKIIAMKQYEKAKELYASAKEELSGPVKFRHQNVDMTSRKVTYRTADGQIVEGSTCKPAMGYSFAAGTTDGPGAFDFKQGMKNGSLIWNLVRNFLKKPSKEMIECQAPKPILLAVGEMHFPYAWTPDIVETQIFQVGQLLIAGMPGEFTTMSGRRIKNTVKQAAQSLCNGKSLRICQLEENIHVVIGGLTNIYSDYIATFEEYQVQRYEAASTIYGPHTLQAYLDQYQNLTLSLIQSTEMEEGPTPPFFVNKLISLVPGVLFDTHPFRETFGSVIDEPLNTYNRLEDVVKVKFVSANPRNNMRLGDTYLTVEKMDPESKSWQVKYTDANWETKFTWKREHFWSTLFGRSSALVEWTVTDIHGNCSPGVYRITHKGTWKNILRKLRNFQGSTMPFTVTCGV